MHKAGGPDLIFKKATMHHVIFKKPAAEWLRKAHRLIDEQESRDRNLFLRISS
jgi:hypothetical protein